MSTKTAPRSLIGATKVRSMTPAETKLLIQCTHIENTDRRDPLTVDGSKIGFIFQVIQKRAQFHGVKMTAGLMLWIASLSNSPGSAILWLYSVHCMDKKDGTASLADWATAFPHIPTEEAMSEVWDAQKDGGANRVDDPAVWKL